MAAEQAIMQEATEATKVAITAEKQETKSTVPNLHVQCLDQAAQHQDSQMDRRLKEKCINV